MTVCPNPKCDHGYVDESTTLGHIEGGEYFEETGSWQMLCPTCNGTGEIEQDETKEKEGVGQ